VEQRYEAVLQLPDDGEGVPETQDLDSIEDTHAEVNGWDDENNPLREQQRLGNWPPVERFALARREPLKAPSALGPAPTQTSSVGCAPAPTGPFRTRDCASLAGFAEGARAPGCRQPVIAKGAG
jgi:hypothetical protein